MKPIILVTPRIDEKGNYILSPNYTNIIKQYDGVPLIVSYNDTSEIDSLLDISKGILLSGGGDIDSSFFGEELNSHSCFIFKERDEFEILLCKKAIEKNIPILGICRGMQVLNVALGGTIIQHIKNHYVEGADGTDLLHEVDIIDGSYFEKIYKTKSLGVNSIHHQVVGKLGKNISPQCYCGKDIIEGIRYEKAPFVVGVQFHPEIICKKHTCHNIIFEKFMEACNS